MALSTAMDGISTGIPEAGSTGLEEVRPATYQG